MALSIRLICFTAYHASTLVGSVRFHHALHEYCAHDEAHDCDHDEDDGDPDPAAATFSEASWLRALIWFYSPGVPVTGDYHVILLGLEVWIAR